MLARLQANQGEPFVSCAVRGRTAALEQLPASPAALDFGLTGMERATSASLAQQVPIQALLGPAAARYASFRTHA